MISARDAIRTARGYLGTPYSEMDCIRLIVMVVRNSRGGDREYRCQGTNWLWRSIHNSGKYRQLVWRGERTSGDLSGMARAGMLAFKRRGEDVHHVGIVAGSRGGEGLTVIHSSSVHGKVVETRLDGSWELLGIHRDIEPEGDGQTGGEDSTEKIEARVVLSDPSSRLNVRAAPGTQAKRIGSLRDGDVVTVRAWREDGWAEIEYDGGAGYVSSEYLERIGDEEQPEEKPEAARFTTLLNTETGATVVLVGAWRTAED